MEAAGFENTVCFGPFKLDLKAGELRKNGGKAVRLPEQPFLILTMLLEHAGEVVTREEIRKRLWPNDTIVEFEHSISAAMNRLRQALGDSAENPRFIETLARRGYRLLVPVEWVGGGPRGLPVDRHARAGVAPEPGSADLPSKSAAFGSGLTEEPQTLPSAQGRLLKDRSALPSAASANLTGKKVSHYRVLELLGGGGMGVVYKAEDIKLGRAVALKFLPEEMANDRAALERFEREARAASSLNHPNICTIHEFGEHEGQPFIAMELLEGQTLRDRLARPLTPGPSPLGGRGEPGFLEDLPSPSGRGCPDGVGTGEGARSTPLPIDELLDLAIQIADGLEAAHHKGITHRDVKPANIFLTTGQQVKILDFGLAKLSSIHSPRALGGEGVPRSGTGEGVSPQDTPTASAPDLHLTKTGMAMGTVAYMSPEQARGEKPDARTDLFSLGVVLYEMATGRQAFGGGSAAETITAILRDRPVPPSQLNPQLPAKLEEIIHKALEKNRDARYQTASEMRGELRSLKQAIDSRRSVAPDLSQAPLNTATPGAVREARLPRRSRLPVVTSLLALIVVLVGGMWLLLSRRSQPRGPLRIVPFTGLSGLEDLASFSPDGKQLAYAWNGGTGTTSHIYVKLIGAGTPLQLTHDSLSDSLPAWSPDGRYIAFIRFPSGSFSGRPLEGQAEVISIPALGGPEHRLARLNLPGFNASFAWSPDGKSVTVGDRPSPAEPVGLFVISSESGEKHRLTFPPRGSWGDADPAFSRDGRTLAFLRASDIVAGDIFLQNADAAEARPLTFDNVTISGLAWTPDGRWIVFSSGRSGLPTLWKVSVSGDGIEPLAGVGENASSPAVSPAGNLLAYTRSESNANIWSTRVSPSSGRVEGSPTKLISGSGQQFDDEFSPDGKRIVFGSDRSGNQEIWVADADGSNATQLTSFGGPLTGTPRWSPDGRWIAFDSRPGGRSGVFVISAEGGTPRRLSPPADNDVVPSWSRDGKWVYFCRNRNGDLDIWKMPSEGGAAVQVTKTGGFEARESKGGNWLYYSRSTPLLAAHLEKQGIWKMPVGGGAERLVLDKATDRLWTLADEYLYFVDVEAEPHATINRLDLGTGKITRMGEVEKDPRLLLGWTGLSVSPGGERIIYPQVDELNSRIMLVENFR